MSTTVTQQKQPEFVIMMGLPAAGKTTTATNMFGNTHQFICADTIKKTHADFDANNPQLLHAWSKDVADGMMEEALNNPVRDMLWDTTGTDFPKVSRVIQEAESAGFNVRSVFVTVTLEESIFRNNNRKEHRVVPRDAIEHKASVINSVADKVSELVQMTIVNNMKRDTSLLA
tara:strand:+ start:22278 stop:22796 length:519 start_codon:yes stop_codon:yes gene_type:complete